ncbi:MAG: STAS domain-containing protein [Actinomycetota bacterium]|nr:STAS domain-containing protein [Actinomycetota bacterium]
MARSAAMQETTSFIGSFPDDEGPGHGLVVVRGDIDAAVVDRLEEHIDGLLAAATRFLMIDAVAVDSYDAELLELLGRTQRRLTPRRGMLQVRGLHPNLLPPPTPETMPGQQAPAQPAPTTQELPSADQSARTPVAAAAV